MKLILKNLSLGYGKKTILQDISCPEVAPGSLIGVLGANGVGKSSLLRSIAGFQDYNGEVLVNGQALQALPQKKRSQLVSYLPQTLPQPTSLTAYEAVISAIRAVREFAPKEEINRLTEQVFDQLGIRHLAFQSLASMSGGQRQLIGLAQVLVRKPELLLLDEPTSALDLKWQMSVFEVVRNTIRERHGICLMAIHDINLAMRQCDYILLLADGQCLSFGTPKDAMTAANLKKAYGVSGRVEFCSQGTPYVIADTILHKNLV